MKIVSRLCPFLFLIAALCGKLHAQFTLSYLSGNSTPASVSGQSFVPGDAGSFTTGSAFLTGMTFQTGSSIDSSYSGVATYLDVYSNSGLTAYVGSSTNSQTWDVGGTLLTKTWAFDNLELDKTATYYAVLSTDAVAGALTTRAILSSTSSTYAGGALIYSGSITPSYETNFTATFSNTASAIPEPSTYAVLAGMIALTGAIVRRRRLAA